MRSEITIRIRVLRPLPGVSTMVQFGKSDLIAPTLVSREAMTFDLELTVDLSSGIPNFLGKFAQGPKDARFVYVNTGQYAGQADTHWARRAKISLMSITREQVEALLDGGDLVLETEYNGTGRDGSPTCASVKGIEWQVNAR